MIVALDGPDGAGKSTVVRGLTDWVKGQGRSVKVVSKWDIFRPGEVAAARFLRGSDQEELRACIAEMPSPARMLFLGWMNTFAATRAREATEDLVILDGYWIKHAAAELLAGCPATLVNAITEAIAPVDIIVFMDVTPEEALRRKGADLAPYECGRDPDCPPARFLTHQAAVREVMLDWARRYGWCVVPAGSPTATKQRVRSLIEPTLRGTAGVNPAASTPSSVAATQRSLLS